MKDTTTEKVSRGLDRFEIELPSWGFANTGTRFGKYIQPAAATNIEEKFSDAAQVHAVTGVCPSLALHVVWDFPHGVDSTESIKKIAGKTGVRPGAINPNLFQDQAYKHGSFGNPDAAVRQKALQHTKDSIEIAQRLNCRDISLWFADGSNYPGTANIRQRKQWFEESLQAAYADLLADQRLLVEYKPFEPAFYHTDIADWGWPFTWQRLQAARQRSWWTRAITIFRKTLSKLRRGCFQKTCWAASTSTIVAMPTMT